MARNYKGIRLKKNRVYSTEDLMEQYCVSRNTVSNWRKAGLEPDVPKRPFLFRGDTMEAFHRARRERTRSNLRLGEFKCTGCKMAVFPDPGSVIEHASKSGAVQLQGRCSECGAHVFRFVSVKSDDCREAPAIPNTTGRCAHEDNISEPGGIWNSRPQSPESNERLIFEWQKHAGKYSEKSIDRHLASIRWLEEFVDFKPFATLTVEDCYTIRKHLKASLLPGAAELKSNSSVQHLTSQIREFLTFLLKQPGFTHLPAGMPGALQLPKSAYAAALPRENKDYPSLDEANDLLAAMPSKSVTDKRARAIFALAFLGALRADTLISLRLGDIDREGRKIMQNSQTARTKNGKSLVIAWFPVPDAFIEAVADWIELVESKGLVPEDALFPPISAFNQRRTALDSERPPIPPMTSCHAVTQSFRVACRGHHTAYTPHAAKHTISAEQDRRSLTREQRKAWSANMGHENERITEAHYGKLPDARRLELMKSLPQQDIASGIRARTNDEKAALLDEIVEKLGIQ